MTRWLRSIEAAAVAGLVFAALSIVGSILIGTQPALSATAAETSSWYSDATNRTVVTVGLSCFAFAAVAFLWFIAVIRRRIGDREDKFIATVLYGSGVLVAGVMLVAAAAVASPAVTFHLAEGRVVDSGGLIAVRGFGRTLELLVLLRLQAVFVVAVSTLAARTGVFSKALSYFGYAMAFVMFVVPILTSPLGLAFPLWVSVVSTAMLVRASRFVGDERTAS
jgi:hypothetical protein